MNWKPGIRDDRSDGDSTRTTIRRTRTRVLLSLGVVCLLSYGVLSANKVQDDLRRTRSALDKWVETSRKIAQQKSQWAMAKETLGKRIGIIQDEIDSLQKKTDEADKGVGKIDEETESLGKEAERLKQVGSSLQDTVTKLESRTKTLLKRLPDPIRDRVKPLSQQIPEKPDDTKLSVSQRFQNIVGILNEVSKFNRNITVTSEVRKLPDGTSVEVTAFYIGIGQAYYAGGKGKIAGVGRPSESGWEWTPANDAAEQITKAIAIHNNEQVASFVQLPIQID